MKWGILFTLFSTTLLTACGESDQMRSAGGGYPLASVARGSNTTSGSANVLTPSQSTPYAPVTSVTPPSPSSQSAMPMPIPPVQTVNMEARLRAIDVVTNLYRAHLGREPEAAGLSYWVDRLLAGVSVTEVENNIVNLPEARERARQMTTRQIMLAISIHYRLLVGREPEVAGLVYYVNRIITGVMTLEQAKAEIENAPEVKIRAAYIRFLGREPDGAGLNFFISQLNAGQSLSAVEYAIANSAEAQIRQMYLRYFRREPDAPGLAYWLAQVARGMSLSMVDHNLRNSPEAIR